MIAGGRMAPAGDQLAGAAVQRRVAQFDMARASLWQNRSRVKLKWTPTSLRVPGLALVQTEAQPEDLPLPLVQGDQHLVDLEGRAASTLTRYRSASYAHVKLRTGHRGVAKVGPAELDGFYDPLVSAGLGPLSVRKSLQVPAARRWAL
jgi:hypothetical protein